MVFRYVWILPTLATLFAFLAFFIGYGVGIAENHLEAWFSYISDGGALSPERCIFSELLNLSAMFVGITIYVRHLQIVEFYERLHHVDGRWRMYSTAMMFLGFMVAFGISIVANFQENSIPIAHAIGAFFAFIFGVVYLWAQVLFTLAIRPLITHKKIVAVRIVLAICTTVGLIAYMVLQFAQPLVPRQSDGTLPTKPPKVDGVVRLYPDSPFYKNHLIATIFEWILGIGLYLFVLSYAFELRFTRVHAPKILLRPKHKNFKLIYSISDSSVINGFATDHQPPTIGKQLNNDDNEYGLNAMENRTERLEYYY